MQFFKTILILATLFAGIFAQCVEFHGTYDYPSRRLNGYIKHDMWIPCRINKVISGDYHWLTCILPHTGAYVNGDMTRIAYQSPSKSVDGAFQRRQLFRDAAGQPSRLKLDYYCPKPVGRS